MVRVVLHRLAAQRTDAWVHARYDGSVGRRGRAGVCLAELGRRAGDRGLVILLSLVVLGTQVSEALIRRGFVLIVR